MKTLFIIITVISLSMCQGNYEPDIPSSEKEALSTAQNTSQNELIKTKNIQEAIYVKSAQILSINDYTLQQNGVVQTKKFVLEDDFYELQYRYPYLDNEIYPTFNSYIENTYLNVEKVVNQILDDKEMQCNEKGFGCDKDIKYLDYKIYSLQEELLSVLLFEENYYAGVAHSSYKFDCLNFDLSTGTFIKFNDLFTANSEDFVRNKINTNIKKELNSGELYYECWELTKEDFKVYKDNFVYNEEHIRFYFDDCVICPSFTGTYYVELPINDITQYINVYNKVKPQLSVNL